MTDQRGTVLVVDDNEANRDLLARQIGRGGHVVALADSGYEALQRLATEQFDLILLDIMMPGMNGYAVLEQIKADPTLRHLPVIMISALDDLDSVIRCIEMGADDYLAKPFNPVLLQARVAACLEKKWLRDKEQAHFQQLEAEREKAERLLLNVLPRAIAERLKAGQSLIVDSFPEVTVLFADIVDFTLLAGRISPPEIVGLLNRVFSIFDLLADQHGLEKIKTIGDAYMVVSGLPTPRPDHAAAMAEMALDMLQEIAHIRAGNGEPVHVRIGIHTGPAIAGVIGTKKFSYDLWGDAVNTASRMEALGSPDSIQVTEATYAQLCHAYQLVRRGVIAVKGKGEMTTYFLTGRKNGG
ncbi:MAG TPA: adenylate/guanylate cyclase domain-containing protein [Chloroflexia bacterium]|nr:adenylate/guanylate cyclase domain-containing protein [Chloroflexia bacterium]